VVDKTHANKHIDILMISREKKRSRMEEALFSDLVQQWFSTYGSGPKSGSQGTFPWVTCVVKIPFVKL
jgi:hypothetical protein